MDDKKTLMTERQAATYLAISQKTLQARRLRRQEPPYIKVGKSVRYMVDDLDCFLNKHRIDPEAN